MPSRVTRDRISMRCGRLKTLSVREFSTRTRVIETDRETLWQARRSRRTSESGWRNGSDTARGGAAFVARETADSQHKREARNRGVLDPAGFGLRGGDLNRRRSPPPGACAGSASTVKRGCASLGLSQNGWSGIAPLRARLRRCRPKASPDRDHPELSSGSVKLQESSRR